MGPCGTGARIAFVTCERLPQIAEDDRLAAEALAARGATVAARVWTDPAVRWEEFDAVVIRSAWDYHLRSAEFLGWLDRLEAVSARVWNPPPLLRWNLDKAYLEELAARGVSTVPMRRVQRRACVSLATILAEAGWDDAVVKPAISASAYRTFRTTDKEAEQLFSRLLEEGDALVQHYQPEVVGEGEWSFCFFGGSFSHAVLKRPRKGDFRTQTELGGSRRLMPPPALVVTEAARALACLPSIPLYARVDGIRCGGEFRLMELELIEPVLHFDLDREAAGRFAASVLSVISRREA
jgi:glutathione synthase/RimK-type ligase-like ATP-grasp enzyme